MAARRYQNFDLLLEQEGDGQYQARVTGSPLGDTPSVKFRLPFDATTLENLLLKLDPGRSGTRRVAGTSEQQAAIDFGGPLYQAIFTGDLALAWQRSLDRARSEDSGLRLRLRLNDAAGIAGLPWELLYDAKSNSFLAQSEKTPLVRFLDITDSPRPIAVDGPLRVLAIISSPTDLEELDVEAEWRRLGDALKQRIDAGLVVLDRLPTATVGALGPWLRRHPTHVIHFVGHGDFDERLREGVIYFQDEQGRSSAVTSSVLGPYIRDHDALRMVVLNACRSARVDGTDPFGGMAQGLVQQDATAVVAMQFPISDRAAVTFTGEFYGALVDGLPVDQAVSSARKALLADFRDEWATPVLFLRAPDGDIFENVHAGDGVPTSPPPPPSPPVPGPSPPWQEWLRGHVPAVAVVTLALVGLVVLGVVILGGDGKDSEAGSDPTTPAATTPSASTDPTPTITPLPTGSPLGDSQLLVAARNETDRLRIYLFDESTGQEQPQALTTGASSDDWRPVLSPDRRTMIYSREREGLGNQLRTAAAIDGSGDRPLFDESSLSECGQSAGRPAWLPRSDELVVRCFGKDADGKGSIRLVRMDMQGHVSLVYDKIGPGRDAKDFGHPAVSPDGRFVVYPVSPTAKEREGSLVVAKTSTGDPGVLLKSGGDFAFEAFGDPVFSSGTDMMAWQAMAVSPDGADPTTTAGYEILAAPFVDGKLLTDQIVVVSGMTPGADQSPTFSRDGTRIIYSHAPVDDPSTSEVEPDQFQELWIATVATPDDRTKLTGDAHSFYSGAAWSRR